MQTFQPKLTFTPKTFCMKNKLTLLLLSAVMIVHSSCVKDLLKKKEPSAAPEAKYYGSWNATQIASDANGNNSIDANEYYVFTGSSTLNLTSDKKCSFSITTSTGSTSITGTWSTSADYKTITINDPAQGSMGFSYRSDTEIQSEPIATGNGTAWIIYKKQ
jgi:hypothetical protein